MVIRSDFKTLSFDNFKVSRPCLDAGPYASLINTNRRAFLMNQGTNKYKLDGILNLKVHVPFHVPFYETFHVPFL